MRSAAVWLSAVCRITEMTESKSDGKSVATRWMYRFNELSEVEALPGVKGKWEAVVNLLGGKGAGLFKMTALNLPVPTGWTITTDACAKYQTRKRELQSSTAAAATTTTTTTTDSPSTCAVLLLHTCLRLVSLSASFVCCLQLISYCLNWRRVSKQVSSKRVKRLVPRPDQKLRSSFRADPVHASVCPV